MILQLNDDIFPQNLKFLRKRHKLSQIALARKTGVSVHFIRGIERGRLYSQLTSAQYLSICQALCVSPSEMASVVLE